MNRAGVIPRDCRQAPLEFLFSLPSRSNESGNLRALYTDSKDIEYNGPRLFTTLAMQLTLQCLTNSTD